MTAPTKTPSRQPGSDGRGVFGPQPSIGAGPAAKAVAEAASDLIRAEKELAKAEITEAVKAKSTGAGLLAGAGILGWLAVQGLLITAGLALALVLPAWAAALIVSVVLLAGGGALAVAGKNKLATPASLDTTKHNVEEDVTWTKAHLAQK